MRRLRSESGQSAVELVALLPLALVVGLAIMSLLAARTAAGQAAAAAHAGAMALIQESDANEAARAALPPPARARAEIDVRGRRVEVTVRPPSRLPFLDAVFASTAAADAGPEASR
jgi:Flp pilus assembly protein TadG